MKKIALFITLTLAVIGGVNAQNQTNQESSASQNAKLSLSNAIEIGFYSSAYGGTQNLSFNSVNDYANGKYTGYQILIVKSNKDYDVSIKTNAENFTYNGSTTPAPKMPASTLSAALYYNGTGGTVNKSFNYNYAPLSANAQDLITDGNKGGFQYFFTRYRATPGFAYPAGTYTIDVVYTATQS